MMSNIIFVMRATDVVARLLFAEDKEEGEPLTKQNCFATDHKTPCMYVSNVVWLWPRSNCSSLAQHIIPRQGKEPVELVSAGAHPVGGFRESGRSRP